MVAERRERRIVTTQTGALLDLDALYDWLAPVPRRTSDPDPGRSQASGEVPQRAPRTGAGESVACDGSPVLGPDLGALPGPALTAS